MDWLFDLAFKFGWQIDPETDRLINENDPSYTWTAIWTPVPYGDRVINIPHWLSRRLHQLQPRDGWAVAREIADNYAEGQNHATAMRHIAAAEKMYYETLSPCDAVE